MTYLNVPFCIVFIETFLTINDMHIMSFERRANLIVGCFVASNDLLVCFPLPRDGRLRVWVSPDVQRAQKRRLQMQTPNGVVWILNHVMANRFSTLSQI